MKLNIAARMLCTYLVAAGRQIDGVGGRLRYDDLGAPDLAIVAYHVDLEAGLELVRVEVDDVGVGQRGEATEPFVVRIELRVL
jgi:hypothetical protein